MSNNNYFKHEQDQKQWHLRCRVWFGGWRHARLRVFNLVGVPCQTATTVVPGPFESILMRLSIREKNAGSFIVHNIITWNNNNYIFNHYIQHCLLLQSQQHQPITSSTKGHGRLTAVHKAAAETTLQSPWEKTIYHPTDFIGNDASASFDPSLASDSFNAAHSFYKFSTQHK